MDVTNDRIAVEEKLEAAVQSTLLIMAENQLPGESYAIELETYGSSFGAKTDRMKSEVRTQWNAYTRNIIFDNHYRLSTKS